MKFFLIVAAGAIAAIGVIMTRKYNTGSLTDSLRDLIVGEEGLRLNAYKDQVGKWTIGYGHLIKQGERYYHPEWNPSGVQHITQEEADLQLIADMQNAINTVNRLVKVSLTQNQRNALISLTYNIGSGNFETSTLLAELNKGNYEAAAAQFAVWNKGTVNGVRKILPVLIARRAKEAALFTSNAASA